MLLKDSSALGRKDSQLHALVGKQRHDHGVLVGAGVRRSSQMTVRWRCASDRAIIGWRPIRFATFMHSSAWPFLRSRTQRAVSCGSPRPT